MTKKKKVLKLVRKQEKEEKPHCCICNNGLGSAQPDTIPLSGGRSACYHCANKKIFNDLFAPINKSLHKKGLEELARHSLSLRPTIVLQRAAEELFTRQPGRRIYKTHIEKIVDYAQDQFNLNISLYDIASRAAQD
ncbi:MAG: hypothetical protein HY764_04610 [Candidatus Portnoybacteria bacterium]|nr:hypothetical protein [Candidatus Portnoybacteria bacterium]